MEKLQKITLTQQVMECIADMTNNNQHSEVLVILAEHSKIDRFKIITRAIRDIHRSEGYLPNYVYLYREAIRQELKAFFTNNL